MEGMITEIQRFSLNDGPGIRTTVFFKGCDMRCLWCHNPETINPRPEILYHPRNCINCLHCVEVCPTKAQSSQDGLHHFDHSKCISCGACAEICYPQAMELSGKKMTVPEILDEIMQDKAYYDGSGGGVTLSGGEVLCQIPFAAQLAKACKEQGISVALETNLNRPYEEMQPLLSFVDLVMCDIKLINDDAHKRWTGADNALVLENVKKLSDAGIPLIVRTPLIPGATDDDQNIGGIAQYLTGINSLQYYELLNFNPLGGSKYDGLGRKNPFEQAKPLPTSRLKELQAVAAAHGIAVRTE